MRGSVSKEFLAHSSLPFVVILDIDNNVSPKSTGPSVDFECWVFIGLRSHVHQNVANLQDLYQQAPKSSREF